MNIFNKVTTQTLKKNRIRTLVTIVGIILSAAMFTAVMVIISSFQQYMIDVVKATDGSWYGSMQNMTVAETEKALQDEEIDEKAIMTHIGYSDNLMKDCVNEDKPYMYITGMTENVTDMIPIKVIEGRMPQNSSEILVPKHLQANGGIELALNQTIKLDIGKRILNDAELSQTQRFINGENLDEYGNKVYREEWRERLITEETRTYTVTGFYERMNIEPYSAPGYTMLTITGESDTGLSDMYFTAKKMSDTVSILSRYNEEGSDDFRCDINSDLLRYSGTSMESSYNMVLYSMAAIFTAIIMFGSISLIYNAFSISLSERMKQFGLMKSIGATKKQIMGSVMFEGLVLSGIAIPIGVLSGIAGIGITLKFLSKPFQSMMGSTKGIEFGVHASVPAIIIAVIVCIITVLISAYIPARRAVRQQPIEAVRQTDDIKMRASKLKNSKLTEKFFGLEGVLASKNFKRNRRKYRATVISLFASIVLFISASSFCEYLMSSVDTVISRAGYDLHYYYFTSDREEDCTIDELIDEFRKTEGVEEAVYVGTKGLEIEPEEENLSQEYLEFFNSKNRSGASATDASVTQYMELNFVEDSIYRNFLSSNGLDVQKYMNTEKPVGLLKDNMRMFNTADERYYTFHLYKEGAFSPKFVTYDSSNAVIDSETGMVDGMKKVVNESEDLIISGACDGDMFFMSNFNDDYVRVLYPYSAMENVLKMVDDQDNEEYSLGAEIYMKADDHSAVYNRLIKTLESRQLSAARLYDYAESMESNRAIVLIIKVFSYGFIVLISLIAAANVFNTISTNISLRRREFAMLRSVGLTKRGMNKMMNYECLLYGLKSLVLGIPVSIVITLLVFISVNNGLDSSFYIPWYSIAISVGSVFAVVFSTMLYAMSKIKKDNPIDALRNENV